MTHALIKSAFFKIAFVLSLLCMAQTVSNAHHSAFGRFDAEKLVVLDGVVTNVLWRNPHIQMTLEVDKDGETIEWLLEGGSPGMLSRGGIKKGMIKVGDRIKAAGWAPAAEKRETFLTNILSPEGEEFLMMGKVEPIWRPSEAATGNLNWMNRTEGDASEPELGIFRVWSFTFDSILFLESLIPNYDLSVYNLTEAAWDSVKNYDHVTDNPTLGCKPKGMPLIMEQPYPMEFVDEGDKILIRIEEYDLVRTVHLDAADATAPDGALLGHSVGEWRDDTTLVVETKDVNWGWFNQEGVPMSQDAEILEVFTVAEDGSRLDYKLTVTDPVNFEQPVKLQHYWLYIAGIEIEKFDCQEGIH